MMISVGFKDKNSDFSLTQYPKKIKLLSAVIKIHLKIPTGWTFYYIQFVFQKENFQNKTELFEHVS